MQFPTTITRRTLAMGGSTLAALMLGGATIAQEATPASEHVGPPEGYPVAIHQGTCDDMSPDAAYEIGNAITFGVGEDEDAEPETVGAGGGAITALLGVSNTVDASIENLGNDGHVVAVHEGEAVVACGQIAGVVDDGQLAMALAPTEGSAVVGVAILDEDDGQTETRVYIFDTASVDEDALATPVS